MRVVLICGVLALAGCGADGVPITPGVNLGVKIGPNGITPSVSASASSGPVTVSVGR